MSWLNDLGRDVLSARRVLARNRMFTLIAVVTLALGIGANTAIFSVVHSVSLRPLPYKDADRIVGLYYHQPVEESPNGVPRRLRVGLSVANLIELRQRTRAISHAGASTLSFMIMTGEARRPASKARACRPPCSTCSAFGRFSDGCSTTRTKRSGPIRWSSSATRRGASSFGADPNVVGRAVTLDDVFARVPPTSERVLVHDGAPSLLDRRCHARDVRGRRAQPVLDSVRTDSVGDASERQPGGASGGRCLAGGSGRRNRRHRPRDARTRAAWAPVDCPGCRTI